MIILRIIGAIYHSNSKKYFPKHKRVIVPRWWRRHNTWHKSVIRVGILPWQKLFLPGQRKTVKQWKILVSSWKNNFCCNFLPIGEKKTFARKNYFCQDGFSMKKKQFFHQVAKKCQPWMSSPAHHSSTESVDDPNTCNNTKEICVKTAINEWSNNRAYFNVPTGTDMLGDLKSVLEGLVTRAWRQ